MQHLRLFYQQWFQKRIELGISASSFLIITVVRLDSHKNVKTLIDALKQLNNRDIQLIICGDGKERMSLEQIAKRCGVEESVHFLGTRSDIQELYQTSDCFGLASFREGLNRSDMEAMASGFPCIISRICGNVYLIDNGQKGFLCDPHRPKEFALAIRDLYKNGKLRKYMKAKALEKICNYDSLKIISKVLNIYQEVMVFTT